MQDRKRWWVFAFKCLRLDAQMSSSLIGFLVTRGKTAIKVCTGGDLRHPNQVLKMQIALSQHVINTLRLMQSWVKHILYSTTPEQHYKLATYRYPGTCMCVSTLKHTMYPMFLWKCLRTRSCHRNLNAENANFILSWACAVQQILKQAFYTLWKEHIHVASCVHSIIPATIPLVIILFCSLVWRELLYIIILACKG